jgi:CBS domain-containing protein
MEGAAAGVRRAVDVARPDVPVCGLRDRVADAARTVHEEGWPLAVVVNEHGVVLGRLRPADLDAHPDAVASDLLVPGPRTMRGTRPADEMAAWLDERRIPGVLVTTADGVLVGYVRRADIAG